jgi:hypothetical protein
MLLAAGVGSPVSQTWWRLSPSDFEVRFSHATRLPTTRPRLQTIRFPDSVARTYTENGVQYTPVETKVSTGSIERLLRRHVSSDAWARRLIVRPARSTADELEGCTGRRTDGAWEELGPGSYRLSASLGTLPHDCFRVLVGSAAGRPY